MDDLARDAGDRPRYRRLADALIADIRAGRIKVGATLPGELELVERHAVSRHTVREALRVLDELGLIDRQQGIGTVVKARDPSEAYVQTVRSPAELLQYPPDSRLVVREQRMIKASRALARVLQCPTGTRWFNVSALRRFRGLRTPICWVELYLLPEFAGVAELIGRRSQLVYEMIEQRYGEKVSEVRVDIRAGTVPESLADALATAAGTPSLTVIRRYRGSGRRTLQISVSEHPADRYTYSLELKRGWEAGGG